MTETQTVSERVRRTSGADEHKTPVGPGADLLQSWKAAASVVTETAAGVPIHELPDDVPEPPGAVEELPERPERGAARRVRLPRLRLVLVAVVVIALIAAAAWLGWDRVRADRLTTARVDATRSAVAVATKMADYSYQTLAKDFAAVEQASTPAFAQTFKKQSASLVSVLQKYQAASNGHVTDAGMEHWTTSRAEILVIVSQTVNNSATAKPSPQENALLLTMVRQHGRWLLDSVSVK